MSSTALRAVVEQVCSADLDAVDVPALQVEAVLLESAIGRLTGRRDQVLAELEARGGAVDGDDGRVLATQVWWRDAAGISGGQAGRDVRRASVLRELPVVAAAVTDGALSPAQGEVLVRLHGQIPVQDLLEAQDELVRVAAGMNPEALARFVRHLIARHSEVSLDREQDAARERRYLQLRHEPDGTVRGTFRLPNEDAEAVLTVLEPLARPAGADDERGAGQRRADALVEVFAGAAAWMDLPTAGGQRPQVSYVLGAAWCAGQQAPSLSTSLAAEGLPLWARSAALGTPGPPVAPGPLSAADPFSPPGTPDPLSAPGASDPGRASGRPGPRGASGPLGTPGAPGRDGLVHPSVLEQHGGAGAWTGPQTRARIEAVLCDARVSRLLLDPHGTVLSLTSLTGQITTAQRRAVSARDRHCVAKGCHRPPAFCDVHHLLARADGGATEIGNLVLLCRRHHAAWHRGRLHLAALHTPWLDHLALDQLGADGPWDGHAPPLIA